MITKTQISPWGDNFYSDFQNELKQTLIERNPNPKKENKFFQSSRKFLSDHQMPNINFKKLLPSQTDIKKYSSVSLNKNYDPSGSNPQKNHTKHQRTLSSHLPTELTQKKTYQFSQRKRKFFSIPITPQETDSQVKEIKKAVFEDENVRLLQNQMYLFSLCKKQQIRWQNQRKKQDQESDQRDQIFKKVDQLSRKRKKQIKLPRISVAYSMQRILH